MEAILVAAESQLARLCADGRIGRFTVAVSACGLSFLVLKGMRSAALRLMPSKAGPNVGNALDPTHAAATPASTEVPADTASALASWTPALDLGHSHNGNGVGGALWRWFLPALSGATLAGLLGAKGRQVNQAATLSILAYGLVQAVFWPSFVPFTHRRRYLHLLPAQLEALLGICVFRVGKCAALPYKAKKEDEALVNEVFGRITAAVKAGHGGGDQGHLQGLEWEVLTVDFPRWVNACALPGGKVAVTTGLLRLLDRQPDLLAAVLGHEVAHVVARHGVEKMALVGTLESLVTDWLPGGAGEQRPFGQAAKHREGTHRPHWRRAMRDNVLKTALSGGLACLLELPFSRRIEWEADVIGLKLMALAGYDPARAPEVFKRFAAAALQQKTTRSRWVWWVSSCSFASTHPSCWARGIALRAELEHMARAGPSQACQRVFTKPWSYLCL